MKRFAFIIISLVLVLACDKDSDSQVDAQDEYLEVSFAYDGNDIQDMELSPLMQTLEIEVTMSHEGVGWKVSSDKEWCVVDDEQTYRGSSKFSVSVSANDELTDREAATITLASGDYKAEFRISQRGKVVVVDKVYALSHGSAGSLDLSVKYRDGIEWTISAPQWLKTEVKSKQPCEDGLTAVVSLEWDANPSEARFGTVGFVNTQDDVVSESFSFYQLGSSYSANETGGVRIAGKDAGVMEIKVPAEVFSEIVCPDWIMASEKTINEDGTESWNLNFSDNPSDVEVSRSYVVKLKSIQSSLEVSLPEFHQDYYPAGGLMSIQGLDLFARRFKEGGDLSSWMRDGKVLIVNDLDLTGVKGWTPIGTEEKPFDMQLDGCGKKISGFQSSSSLLGVCENAVISNLIFDNTCELSLDSSFDGDVYLAPLAARISNTTISKCESNAKVKLAGSAVADGLKVCVGGLVAAGEGDISINGCLCKAEVTMQYIPKSDQSVVSVGGTIGYVGKDSKFTVKGSDWDGNIIYDVVGAAVAGTVSVGGVVGLTDDSVNLTIEEATAKGKIEVKANSKQNWNGTSAFGGVVGAALTGGIIRKCINDCEIKWAANTAKSNGQMSAMGGIVGRIESGMTEISACTNNAPLTNQHYNNNGWSARFTALKTGGIIGWYGKSDQLDKATSNIRIENCHNTSKVFTLRGFTGGIAGYIVNADVSGCTFTGDCKADNNANPYVGGIVGGVQYSVIRDSKVKADLSSFSGGSCDSRAGGIVGLLYSDSEVRNCFYSGAISTGDNKNNDGTLKEVYFGGIAADTETTCTVAGCGFNGSLPFAQRDGETPVIINVDITAQNYHQYVTGDGQAAQEKNIYWEGN